VRVLAAVCWAVLLSGASDRAYAQVPTSSRTAWLALLHYWGADGRWSSEVDDSSFFLDPDGRRDPGREWDADVRAFLAPAVEGGFARHAQCQFPARFELIKQSLGWPDTDVPRVECKELAEMMRSVNATTLSVVSISHYLSNPASAFGHTMLYLGSGTKRNAVLADYAVSFEASLEGLSTIQYVSRGLFGGLAAAFRVEPFDARVRRYQREQQRDLWVFPLQMRQDEIDQLVRHLWELKDVSFVYGFYGENCAQKLLAVVHAVAPEYNVLPYVRAAVLPLEAGRRLVEMIGLAAPPIFRPSLFGQYDRQVARLGAQEKKQLGEMVASRTVIEGASPATLSAALLWSEFATPLRAFRRAADTADHADQVWRRDLWTARVASGADVEQYSPALASDPSPLQAHLPSRFKLGAGFRSGGGSEVSASMRWLLHEAVDLQAAYPPNASLEAARIDVSVSGAGKVSIDEVTALRVESLAPASELQPALAWKFDLGARPLTESSDTPLHLGAEVDVGVGSAHVGPSYSAVLYSMVGVRPGVALQNGTTLPVSAGIWSGGLLLHVGTDFRARLSGEYVWPLGSSQRGGTALKIVTRRGLRRDVDLELSAMLSPRRSGATLSFVSFR
jgi:hypothetical protein